MNNQYINFKRKRELGDIITDTFKFLRRNFKPVFRNLFKISGIPFLLFVLATVYNGYTSYSSIDVLGSTNPFAAFDSVNILVSTLLVYAAVFVFLIALQVSVLSTIKSYITNEGVIDDSQVMATVKEKLGDITLAGFGKTVLSIIGFLLCFIPGVYIAIPFFLIFPLIIFDNKKAGDVFSACFDLVKDNWWITFATVFILGLLWYVISIVFSLPAMIYVWVKMFTSMQESSMADPSGFYDVGTIILTVISSSLQYIAYAFMPIGAAFVYYNLNEQKNQTGTLEQIDRLGE